MQVSGNTVIVKFLSNEKRGWRIILGDFAGGECGAEIEEKENVLKYIYRGNHNSAKISREHNSWTVFTIGIKILCYTYIILQGIYIIMKVCSVRFCIPPSV